MKRYECESCGYHVCAEKTPRKCPTCRARFFEKGECGEKGVEVTCPECDETFYYNPNEGAPFKCAFCDHTFSEMDYF